MLAAVAEEQRTTMFRLPASQQTLASAAPAVAVTVVAANHLFVVLANRTRVVAVVQAVLISGIQSAMVATVVQAS